MVGETCLFVLALKQLLKKNGSKIFVWVEDRFTNYLTNWEWIRIRVDGRIRVEYRYVGTWKFWIRKEKFADSKISEYSRRCAASRASLQQAVWRRSCQRSSDGVFRLKRKKIPRNPGSNPEPRTRTCRILTFLLCHYTTTRTRQNSKIPKNLNGDTSKLSFLTVTSGHFFPKKSNSRVKTWKAKRSQSGS